MDIYVQGKNAPENCTKYYINMYISCTALNT